MKKITLLLLPLLMGGSVYAQCVVKADLKDVTGDTAIVQLWKPDFTGLEKTDTLKVSSPSRTTIARCVWLPVWLRPRKANSV